MWEPITGNPNGGRAKYHEYTPEDVRLLQRMVKRHLTVEHEFVVITNRVWEFEGDPDIRAVEMGTDTHVPGTCYARLFTFSPEFRDKVGDCFFQMDLDTIPVGNFDHVVDRPEEIVMWRNPGRIPWDNPAKNRPFYNTSFVMHRPGTLPAVYSMFDRANIRHRDDQWFLSYVMGPDVPYWNGDDGIYRLARDDTPGSGVAGELPDNACLVTFPGSESKPWMEHILKANPWIKEHRV